nr:MAG TPA: hypothetical protein [Caudoviricetes sp.]
MFSSKTASGRFFIAARAAFLLSATRLFHLYLKILERFI